MSPFETQVAQALVVALLRTGDYAPDTRERLEAGTIRPPIVDDLAPRVAAAIRAAHGSQSWKAAERLDELALAALRGTPT